MSSGPSDTVKNRELDISQQQMDLAKHQAAGADELRGLTEPGLKIAENYYTKLSSGDPNTMFTAVAPAAEQISQAATSAKDNIDSTAPRGGEQRLAKEAVDINKAGQTGRLITQSFTSSFPALASLANTGIGLSLNQAANSISAYGGAANTIGNVGSQEAAGKASTMGFLGSLAGAGGGVGAAAVCWIAEVLFGKDDERTLLLRHWLNNVFEKQSWMGKIIMSVYRKYGVATAARTEKNVALRTILRPIFLVALWRARQDSMFVKPRFFEYAVR